MPTPLRFCMITTFYPPYHFGGDGVYVHRLSNELGRRGHHVEVIHNADAYRVLAHHEPQSGTDNHPNVIVHTLRSSSPLLSTLAMQQSGTAALHARQIRDILAKQFDVIHHHNVSLAGGPEVLGLPPVGHELKLYTVHEYWLICPTHVLFRFNRQACTQRACLACQLFYRRPPQLWRYTSLLQRSAAHVHAFLSPSHFAADKHREYGFAGPFVHLPSGGPQAESPVETVDSTSEPYFLYVGRLEKLKGLHTIIPLFRRYNRAQLWVAGTGTQESRLRALAADCSNVRFLGQRSRQELAALYRRAVAVILPSLCFEVFSLVEIEALQHGTPVIVRNLGALPEVVHESGGGLIYNTDEELLSAMDHLLSNRAYRDELGQSGYHAYVQRWTLEAHVEAYLVLIERLRRQTSPTGSRGVPPSA